MDMLSASGHSFEKLCLKLREELVHYAMQYCRTRDLAEDVVQDALVRALNAWPKWKPRQDMEPRAAFRSWLMLITTRVYFNHHATETLHGAREVEHGHEILDRTYGGQVTPLRRGVGQCNADASDWVSNEVKEAIANLRQPFREAIERHYLRGESCEEIGKATKNSAAVVGSILQRGRQQLRPLLASYAEAVYGITPHSPETRADEGDEGDEGRRPLRPARRARR